ncbi:MAG: Fe(3+) dicitrate ABC transporter substrate-binding protein [Marinovum algicola]|uniref:Iron complex transport system substrate-binding protein n=2 Tax=Roseobacteraceae TaxID=2854170 RepID=A0A975WA54_9RHOB|nr:iron complex transport system substrate-binding protein [Marinovum algicola]SLN33964.1 Fe(3+)-citrate-binding protein YfmC precursor [Marinovum algicola]
MSPPLEPQADFMKFPTVFLALALAAGAAQARDVTHELGTTDVPDSPERIVVLEFSFIDALAALNLAPVGIADDDQRDRVQPVWSERIGDDWTSVGTRKTPNLEIIASLQPDLIIADKSRHAAVYETLGQIAPTVVYDSLTGDYEDMLAVADEIGTALGRAEEMDAFQAGHGARMDALRADVSEQTQGDDAQFGVINANGLWLHSPKSYVGSLLASFGFAPAMPLTGSDSYGELYQKTTLEQLSALDPGLLILGKSGDGRTLDQDWNADSLWQQIDAVERGRLFNVSSDLWSRARGMLTAEEIAADIRDIAATLK